ERVLPHVELQDRRDAERGVALLVVELVHEQARAYRVPREHGPAGALEAVRRGAEVRDELVERAEELVDRGRELADRLVAAVRREVVPEDRVVDVTAEVEG